MASTSAARTGMSLDELTRRGDERFELIDGEIVPMTPRLMGHDDLKQVLYMLLRTYIKTHHLGQIYIASTFSVTGLSDPNWVNGALVPDVSFFVGTRIADYKEEYYDWQDWPLPLIPDLIAEVQPLNEAFPPMLHKVAYALSVGVREAWVINQSPLSVTVYKANSEPVTYSADQTLTSELLPGWNLPVRNLFVNTFEV